MVEKKKRFKKDESGALVEMTPRHEVTEYTRNQVKLMVASGLANYQIAKIMQMDQKTLKKHYEHELEVGLDDLIGKVGTKLIMTALSDKPNALSAQQYFLSRRGKGLWTENKSIEVSGPNGGAISVQRFDFDQLEDEQIDYLENILEAVVVNEDEESAKSSQG